MRTVCVCNPFLVAVAAPHRMRCIHSRCYFQKFLSHEKIFCIIVIRLETARLVKTRFTEQLSIKIAPLVLLGDQQKERQGKKDTGSQDIVQPLCAHLEMASF